MMGQPRNQDRADAVRAGRTKYQGKPCRKGHPGVRYTANKNCVVCAGESSAKQRAEKAEPRNRETNY